MNARLGGPDRLARWTEANFAALVELVGEGMGFLDIWSADPDSVRFAVSRAQRLLTQRVVADACSHAMKLEPRIAVLLDDCRTQALLTLADHMDEVFAGIRPGKSRSRRRPRRKTAVGTSLLPVRPPSDPPGRAALD